MYTTFLMLVVPPTVHHKQEFGATNVVGLCSVGALHQHTALGSIIVPDDFWCPYDLRSGFDDARSHISPGTVQVLREPCSDNHPHTHHMHTHTQASAPWSARSLCAC